MLDLDKIKTNIIALQKDEILPTMAVAIEHPLEKKLIILIDIVGFSKGTTHEQVYKIYAFEHYVFKHVLSNMFSFEDRIKINQFIPTGDGCYIVADECDPKVALDFLVTLISGFQYIEKDDVNPWALRASALFGECVPFLDLAHHKNFVGEGMNEAARILTYGQTALEKQFIQEHPEAQIIDSKVFSRNSLYVGDSLSSYLEDYVDNQKKLFKFSQVADKHGKSRDITVLQGLQ